MSQLIDQLQQLKTALIALGEKYQSTVSELIHLKSQPSFSQEHIQELQAQIDTARDQQQAAQQALDANKKQHQDLEKRYQNLADAYSLMGSELERAQAQIQALNDINQKLIEKNRVAADHTKVVLARLAKIDSEA